MTKREITATLTALVLVILIISVPATRTFVWADSIQPAVIWIWNALVTVWNAVAHFLFSL